MEITQEQINKIFELASMDKKFEQGNITSSDISEALIEIERKIYSFNADVKVDSLEDKKILIADDLELSIYQLSKLLKKIGVNPRIARHKDEAISEMQKAQFDCVIIDLFIPDSSDGLELIKTAVKKREESGIYSKIVVISGTDDSSLINKCYELGTDFYIQKDSFWHNKLIQYISTAFQSDKNSSFTRSTINNSIVSYSLKRFNEQKVFDSVIKDINYSVFSGLKNVIFDLTEITLFDIDNAYIFAEIFKICSENEGKFILVNPSIKVKEALSFAYLEDVIKCVNSVEDAIKLIQSNV